MPEWLRPLAFAFWQQVILDLRAGDGETRLWLETGFELGGFLWWCELTKKDRREWKALLQRL